MTLAVCLYVSLPCSKWKMASAINTSVGRYLVHAGIDLDVKELQKNSSTHGQTQQKICRKVIITLPTTHTYCYTILWNIDVRKHATILNRCHVNVTAHLQHNLPVKKILQVYLLTLLDRTTLFNAKSPISYCTPSVITRQRASVDSKLLDTEKSRILSHIWTIMLKIHLVDLLSIRYITNFAADTVTDQSDGAYALVYCS